MFTNTPTFLFTNTTRFPFVLPLITPVPACLLLAAVALLQWCMTSLLELAAAARHVTRHMPECVQSNILRYVVDARDCAKHGWTDILVMYPPNCDRSCALYWAARYGHSSCVSSLISLGACVELVAVAGQRALHAAAEHGHVAVLLCLVEHGAAVNDKDNGGWTALYYAAWWGHVAVVQYLVEHGAAVNHKDKYGRTASRWAKSNGHSEVVKYLESVGGRE